MSVHARFAATYSKRADDVQRMLGEGVGADLGERWDAVAEAAAMLSATPSQLGPQHIARLRASGLDDLAILHVIQSAAFRLGQPPDAVLGRACAKRLLSRRAEPHQPCRKRQLAWRH